MGNEIALLDRRREAIKKIKECIANETPSDLIILKVLEDQGLSEKFTQSILKRLGYRG